MASNEFNSFAREELEKGLNSKEFIDAPEYNNNLTELLKEIY